MYKLHGHPYSHNARKVHWALEELGWPYDYQTVDLMTGGQKASGFLTKNPNGRVPVLEDGDLTLFESNAILWHLGEKDDAGRLLPRQGPARSLVHQWLSWQASDLSRQMLSPWMMKFLASSMVALDEAAHKAAVGATDEPLKVLNGALTGRKFIVGDSLSLADISLAESVGLAEFAGVDLQPHAAIRAWFAGLSERPAFRKTRPTA